MVYADPIWPKLQTLALSFSGLTKNEAMEALAFFSAYLGREIKLVDWESRPWRGVIVSPDAPMIEDSRGRYSLSFEFEGVPIEAVS